MTTRLALATLAVALAATAAVAGAQASSTKTPIPRRGKDAPARAAVTARYPAWFLATPPGAAVGFAQSSRDLDSAYARAEEDARESLRRAAGIRVRAEMLFENEGRGSAVYRGERYDEEPLADAPPTASRLAAAPLGDMVLVLVGPGAGVASALRAPSVERPAWIAEPPRDAHYAVGIAPAYFREQGAWEEAELNGRRSLAYSVMSRERDLRLQQTDDVGTESSGVTASATAAELRGVHVVARWRDRDHCFVLVRAAAARPLAIEDEK